jgi:hypothetical protein
VEKKTNQTKQNQGEVCAEYGNMDTMGEEIRGRRDGTAEMHLDSPWTRRWRIEAGTEIDNSAVFAFNKMALGEVGPRLSTLNTAVGAL